MARLTPIDYQMQVINPMAAALQGYQAGFGQMQQLDEVRRQREADEMAKQRFEAEMAQTQAATARAQEVQTALGDIWGRMADGENVTVQDLQRVQSRFPEVADQLQSLTENLTAEEKSDKFFDTIQLVSLAQTPDLYRAELNQRIEASESNPEQQRALQAQLQAYDAAEQAQEGGGAAYARMVGGMAALQYADTEQQFNLVSERFFPEPEEYESAQDATGVRRYTEGPNIGQPVPGFEQPRPTTPPVQVQIGGGLYDPNTGQIILPSGPPPDPTTAAGAEQPTQDVTPASLMEAGKTPTGYESIPTPEGNMLQTIRNSPQETASISFAANTIDTINLINDFLEDPYAPKLYGTFERQLVLSGPRRGTQAKLNQLLGGSFLTAVRELKDAGAGGSLTENEGRTAQAAQTRFGDTLQEWGDAKQALIDYREKLQRGLNRSMIGVRPEAWEENQLDPRFKPENMGGTRIFNSDQAPASEDLGAVDREELEAVVQYYLRTR